MREPEFYLPGVQFLFWLPAIALLGLLSLVLDRLLPAKGRSSTIR